MCVSVSVSDGLSTSLSHGKYDGSLRNQSRFDLSVIVGGDNKKLCCDRWQRDGKGQTQYKNIHSKLISMLHSASGVVYVPPQIPLSTSTALHEWHTMPSHFE